MKNSKAFILMLGIFRIIKTEKVVVGIRSHSQISSLQLNVLNMSLQEDV